MAIKRLIIDVLTPLDPSILAFAEDLGNIDGIDGVSIRLIEQDDRTRTTEMAIEGESLHLEDINAAIERLGGSIHSIDEVSAGNRMVEFRTKTGNG